MAVQRNIRTRPANSTQGPDRQSPHTNPPQGPGPQPSSTIPVDAHIFHFPCITSRDVTAIHDLLRIASLDVTLIHYMLREIAARLHNKTEPSGSIPGPDSRSSHTLLVQGPDPQPSPTTPDHRHDFQLCKLTTRKGKQTFEVPIIEDIMHVYIEMHVSSASTEAGQGMVQLLVGADGGTSGFNEDDFFPQTVQGPRREAELALSRANTKEIWRAVRLSRPRDSAILGLREWENKKVPVREVIWHKFARRIGSSYERTWNEWLKEWEHYLRQEDKKVWQGQRRLDRDSRWQAMRNGVVFEPEGGCLYCADDKCNGCSGC